MGVGQPEQKETKFTKNLGCASAFFSKRRHVEKIVNANANEAHQGDCQVRGIVGASW